MRDGQGNRTQKCEGRKVNFGEIALGEVNEVDRDLED